MADIAQIREWVGLWDGRIPEARYAPDGTEFLSSRIRRAVAAEDLQRAAEAADPRLAEERKRRLAEAEAAERQRRCADMEAEHHAETPHALRRMGLAEQEALALANLEERDVVRQVREWWRTSESFAVLGGLPGSGKTIAAASLLLECREYVRCESVEGWQWRANRGLFAKAQELGRLSLYGEESAKRLRKLQAVRLLVLDDVGAEAKSEPTQALLDELIDARARNQGRTVITTNLRWREEFEPRYGARICRRLRDFGRLVAAKAPLGVVA